MQELREGSIQFIYNVFADDCKNDRLLKFESDYFNNVVDNAFEKLIIGKKPAKKPFLLKLGGQSGAGKTTQLLPSLSEGLNDNYVHIAVRIFASSHPYYDNLLEKYGEGLIREKTNGFALMCLFAVAEKLIKSKFNVLFEVTLLDPVFEEYFARLAKNNGYNIIYNILSVPLKTSNNWIKARLENSDTEKNRIVSKENIDFFYKILPQALKKISELGIFNKNDYIVLWNTIDPEPLLVTNDFNDNILELFNEFRENTNEPICKEIALHYKKMFYNDFLNKVLSYE